MKVLLISADNIYLTPYVNMYLKLLEECGIDWNVLYWDKNGNEALEDSRYIRFSVNWHSKVDKLKGYVAFRKKIKQKMNAGEFDFFIPLHQVADLLIWRTLSKTYRNRYIYDIRDYSYERFAIVRWIEKKLVDGSCLNVISSEGYKNFLPKGTYEIVHNLPKFDCTSYKQLVSNESGSYVISYIGLVRFMEQNRKIIDFFKNDSRFHLKFIGTNAEQLEEYCRENQVKNVSLIGTFDAKQTLEFYKDTDIIMNLYGNRTPLLDYALSNKLYYAAMLYKPILVCEETYMEKLSGKYGFGYTLKMQNPEEKDELFDFMENLNREKMMQGCDEFIATANRQNEELYEKIRQILRDL